MFSYLLVLRNSLILNHIVVITVISETCVLREARSLALVQILSLVLIVCL